MPTQAEPAIAPMAEVAIEKTVRAEKKGKHLLDMKISRNEEGIIIQLQSDVDWIGALKDKRYKEPQYLVGGVECYASKPIELENQSCYFNQPDYLMVNGVPNMTILLAKGLQYGRRFVCTQPMSADKLREWAKQIREAAKEAFNSHLRPVDIQMTITVETHESETKG